MFRYALLLFTLLLVSKESYALEKTTRRHSMCGVERYVTLHNDPRCPISGYISKASPVCKPIYKMGTDFKACGKDPTREKKMCVGQGQRIPADPDFGCNNLGPKFKLTIEPLPASCRNEKFGLQEYESCADPSHGIAGYQSCALPSFPVESYNECSFYKTPEELSAFIDATNESFETYSLILPNRKAELFSRTNDERAFACLIRTYKTRLEYETLIEDLEKKFLLVFGFNAVDSTVDCNDGTQTEIKFTLGTIDCDSLTLESITGVVKPEGASDTQFSRFKQSCTLKKSHDNLIDWFETKKDEIELLMSDLAAQKDSAAQSKLTDLKTKIDSI